MRIGQLLSARQAIDPRKHPDEVFDLLSIPAFDEGSPETVIGSQIGSTKLQVSPSDVLVSKIVPHIQRVWVVPPGGDRRQIASSEWIVLRADVAVPDYLRYALLDTRFHARFMATVDGLSGSLQRARPQAVRQIEIKLPTICRQRAIADYLDRETAQIDAFIAKNEELITLLTERRAAEIELALAPRELPATWDSVQIRRLGPKSESGVSVNGFSVPAEGDEIGVLKTGAVSKGFFDPAENKRVVAEDLGRVTAPVRGGSLIVNRANTPELVGSAALVVESRPTLYLSDKLWQLTFESANAAYMHYWTKTDAYRSQLRGLSVGASLSMQNLSYGDFLSVRISVPPRREQAELVARLNEVTGEIDRAIDAARRGSDLARERRAALIAAAVTGKIDVGVKS